MNNRREFMKALAVGPAALLLSEKEKVQKTKERPQLEAFVGPESADGSKQVGMVLRRCEDGFDLQIRWPGDWLSDSEAPVDLRIQQTTDIAKEIVWGARVAINKTPQHKQWWLEGKTLQVLTRINLSPDKGQNNDEQT